MKSVKRTAEKSKRSERYHSVVRFTDYKSFSIYPSSELLGYFHSSALRTDEPNFSCEPRHNAQTKRLDPNESSLFVIQNCQQATLETVEILTRDDE